MIQHNLQTLIINSLNFDTMCFQLLLILFTFYPLLQKTKQNNNTFVSHQLFERGNLTITNIQPRLTNDKIQIVYLQHNSQSFFLIYSNSRYKIQNVSRYYKKVSCYCTSFFMKITELTFSSLLALYMNNAKLSVNIAVMTGRNETWINGMF